MIKQRRSTIPRVLSLLCTAQEKSVVVLLVLVTTHIIVMVGGGWRRASCGVVVEVWNIRQ
eukprot:scaffold2498_cov74-Cyclotella_meneghiniana.AAC.8